MQVAIGVDSHKGSLAAAAVDEVGRVIGAREFQNHPEGHDAFLDWVRGQGQHKRIGVEGSLNYGAALTKYLLSCGEDVREVPASLTHAERRKRRSQGKSDLVDAVAIARVVAGEEDLPSARRTAQLADLKLLVDYRDQLARARTQVSNRAHADLAAIRPGYERAIPKLITKGQLAKARRLVRGDPRSGPSSFADAWQRSLGSIEYSPRQAKRSEPRSSRLAPRLPGFPAWVRSSLPRSSVR